MSAPDAVYLSRREQIERACDVSARMQAPLLPALRRAADGRIALMQIEDPGAAWPRSTVERFHRPTLIVIGDDPSDGRPALGPDGWACATRLKYWLNGAIVHGAADRADDYRAAADAAEVFGRVALIETSSAMAPRWGEFLNCPQMIYILPRTGPHPIAPSRESMQ